MLNIIQVYVKARVGQQFRRNSKPDVLYTKVDATPEELVKVYSTLSLDDLTASDWEVETQLMEGYINLSKVTIEPEPLPMTNVAIAMNVVKPLPKPEPFLATIISPNEIYKTRDEALENKAEGYIDTCHIEWQE